MYTEETEVGQTTVVCALNASWGKNRLGKRGCGTLKGIRAWFKEDEMKTKGKERSERGSGEKKRQKSVGIGREKWWKGASPKVEERCVLQKMADRGNMIRF